MDTSQRIRRQVSRGIVSACLLAALPGAVRASNCNGTSVGLIPINDLGAGLYHGVEGGLYPGGSNVRPPAHDTGLARTGRFTLLNTAGAPDPNGRFVLMSIGMSNATQEFSRFRERALADPQRNARTLIVDAAIGGQTAALISDPNYIYWSNVDQRLANAGSGPLQVQAVWLKEADAGPTALWPGYPDQLLSELRAIVQIIRNRYPNTRAIYLSSRTYGGYASTPLNPEPFAYDSGFAVKWLIEQQLDGDPGLNFDPDRGAVAAPWLSWGPYLWADGLTPRSDGLTWECADFVTNDGTHPSDSGRNKVAAMLLGFFKGDATTAGWFADCDPNAPGVWGAPLEVIDLDLAPGPSGAPARLTWQSLALNVGPGTPYDVMSGGLRALAANTGFAGAACLSPGVTSAGLIDPSATPPPDDGFWFLVRGRNGCGSGTWGDSDLIPDPRDLLDAGIPACQ